MVRASTPTGMMFEKMQTFARPLFGSMRASIPLLVVGNSDGSPASELQCTLALVKNIVGTGVLTLPVGISRLSENGASSTEALSIAIVLLFIVGAMNAWGFLLIGEACAKTRQGSYVGAWKQSIGPELAFLPAIASLLLCFTASVSCASVIADTSKDLIAGLMNLDFDSLSRDGILATVAVAVLGPLCLLPSLAPIGSASVLGLIGVAITGMAMLTRFIDGSYSPSTGSFAELAHASPHFTNADFFIAPSAGSIALFVSLLSNAFLAHYNAPSVYNELQPSRSTSVTTQSRPVLDPIERLRSSVAAEKVNAFFQEFISSIPDNEVVEKMRERFRRSSDESPASVEQSLSGFRRVVAYAFVASALLFVIVAMAGFCTFGDASDDIILNNYASSDPLAGVARAGILAGVIFEFPLLERPFRLTMLEILGLSKYQKEPWVAGISVVFLTCIAALNPPLESVAALGGSTAGALLIYVAPAIMGLRLDEKPASNPDPSTRSLALWVLALAGAGLGGLGFVEALQQLDLHSMS